MDFIGEVLISRLGRERCSLFRKQCSMFDVLFDVRLQDHQNHPQDHLRVVLVIPAVVPVVHGVVLVVLNIEHRTLFSEQ